MLWIYYDVWWCIYIVQASYSQPDGGFCFRNVYWLRRLAADYFNPKPWGYINSHCRAAWSHIWLLRRLIGESEALCHVPAVVGSSRPTLRKSWDHVGSSRTAWCVDYWRGDCTVQGWWWRVSQKLNKPSKPPEIYKNGKKQVVSRTFWLIKRWKRRFSLKST